MVPVGCTDATAASLASDVYLTKDRAEVCPEAEIKKEHRKHQAAVVRKVTSQTAQKRMEMNR